MKVTKKKAADDKVWLSAVATASDVDKVLQMAQEGFARSMGLAPDPNKTVAQAVEERLGIRDLDSMVAENAMELLIPMALDKRNIVPAFLPQMQTSERLRRGSAFKFELEVALKPKHELSSYDPVEIEVVPFAIADEDVEREIQRMTGSFTAYVADTDADPERPVAPGDFIKLAIDATQDGEPLKGLNTDGRTYAVSAGHMPESFDEQIVGMKVGEEKEFDFEGPSFDPDNEDDADRIHAKVRVVELQREETPDFDDDWVKVHMPIFRSAQEMRDNVRKELELSARESYDTYLRQAVAVKLSERFEGRIDDEVYQSMMPQIRSNMQRELQQQGKDWDEFVEENGGESQMTMMLMLQAREVITQGYALDAVFRHFGLSVDASDVEQVCRMMNPEGDPRMMRLQAEQAGQGFALREMAERFKANQYALDHARIAYVEQ